MRHEDVSPPEVYPNYRQRVSGKTGIERLALTAFPAIPRHAYHPFMSELRTAIRRLTYGTWWVRRQYRDRRNLLLNIGCGACGKPGWENVDLCKIPEVNCVYDCRRDLPFADNSAKFIFTEHFFEHIDYAEEAPYFLTECCRVLEPGGVIRIVIPDAEKYMRAYCADGWDEMTRVRPLKADHSDVHYGSKFQTKMEVVNAVFRQYFEHKYAYDYATLEFLLKRYGFAEVYKMSFGKSLKPELCLDQANRASESLYVEGVKH
jgi:predicted SAM-dependent methyltransferase